MSFFLKDKIRQVLTLHRAVMCVVFITFVYYFNRIYNEQYSFGEAAV
jgi:hypothetical protein